MSVSRTARIYNQRGIVSLVICMILMIIITLITLSFAAISRREQRQALDSQLSTQAFYAAETGVNDAIKAIELEAITADVTNCTTASQAVINPPGVTANLDAPANIARTCVLVDLSPGQLEDVVGTNDYKIYRINAPGMVRLDIYWQNDDISAAQAFPNDTGVGSFLNTGSWNTSTRPGVLAIQLIPGGFPLTRATIAAGTRNVYGYPTSNASNRTHSAADPNGEVLTGGCTTAGTPRHCRVTLNFSGLYYLRLRAVYDPVNVAIRALDAANNNLSFVGAQVMIDSTGRAGDVVKRLKVYKSFLVSSIPSYALEIADDLCKRLQTEPSLTTADTPGIPTCSPTGP